MSSRPKRNRSTGPQATTTQAAETGEASVRNAARDEDNQAVSWTIGSKPNAKSKEGRSGTRRRARKRIRDIRTDKDKR